MPNKGFRPESRRLYYKTIFHAHTDTEECLERRIYADATIFRFGTVLNNSYFTGIIRKVNPYSCFPALYQS